MKNNKNTISFIIVGIIVIIICSICVITANAADSSSIATNEQDVTTSTDPTQETTETQTGWINSGKDWNYVSDNGSLYRNGLYTIDGKDYYFNNAGVMVIGTHNYKGKLYFFSKTGSTPEAGLGAMLKYKGWKKINSRVYYFNSNFSLANKWKKISDKTFYFSSDGKMVTGWKKISNKLFYFKKSGKIGIKGKMFTGWSTINKKHFYFATTGSFGKKGAASLGLSRVGKHYFYFKKSGSMGTKGAVQTGWRRIGKNKYFFAVSGKRGTKGRMARNAITGIKKTDYAYVDSSGKKVTTKAVVLATSFVLNHTSDKQSRSQKLKTCYDYLCHNFSYQRIYGLPDSNNLSNKYAEYILSNRRGNCFCFGAAFVCIAKVLGYEAREGVGMIAAAGGGMTPHGWAEVKVNGTWLLCDPDMQLEIPSINVYMKTRASYPYPLSCNNHYLLTFKNANAVWKKTA